MKYSKLCTGILALFVMFMATGCERNTDEDFGDAVIGVLNDDGTPVSTQQILGFNASSKLKIEIKNVASTSITTPAGWGCEISISQRTLTITSPDIDNIQAAAEGEVVITAKGVNGSTASATVSVKALEDDMELRFTDPDITDPVEFVLLGNIDFSFEVSSNVADLELSDAPGGWTLDLDWDNRKLNISAPTDVDENTAATGSISVTPVSNRGAKGTPVNIRVQADITAPVLQFDQSEVWFTYGQSQEVAITKGINIKEVKLAEMVFPEGWTVTPDIPSQKITIVAPANLNASELRGGKIVIPVVSPSDLEAEAELAVMIGICDMADMLDLGDAVAAGTELNGEFAIKGEVRLMNDIDLSLAARDVIVGATDKPFTGTFNGNGKKLTLAISATGADAGLFHTLGAKAVVKNLTLAGTINSAVEYANIGVAAINNDGAELNGITSSVAFTYTGASNSGYYGGIVALSRGSGAKYVNCHTTGAVVTNGIKYFGALVGYLKPDTQGTMTDCSNSGNIVLNYGATNMANAHVAGCVGHTHQSKWSFTRISNTGNIDYNFGQTNSPIYGLGGAFGTACGTFTDCFNTGNIIDTDGEDAILNADRCIGGFAGQNRAEGYPTIANGCYNTGDVVGISNFIGGFMGGLRSGTAAAPHRLTDCSNSGDVRVVSKTTISGMFAGFLSVSYQYTNLTRCKNSGRVIGNTNRSAAGIIAAGADNLVIDQCENSGNIYVGSRFVAEGNPKFGRPLVGGIAALRSTNPVRISNSKNSGTIISAVHDATHVQSAYASEVVTVDGKADPTICDEATRTASAGASVTAVLVDQWGTITLPEL